MPCAIASCGRASETVSPFHRMVPPLGACTPVSSLIRVDLPAPFSPTIAWISPFSKARSTDFSACVPVKRLSSPRSSRIGAMRPGLLHLRVQQFLRARRIHVVPGDEVHAGIDEGGHLLAPGGGERGLDAVIPHAVRV